MPDGTIISHDNYPVIVMQDRVGVFIFVMGDRFRHYCLDKKHAIEAAAVWPKD